MQLIALPVIGSPRPFHRKALKGTRMLPITGFEHCLIFYSATGQSLKVIRVLHAARDFPTIFKE
jgi:hypothetical protein